MELNQKIHEWLGLCWHEIVVPQYGDSANCKKCGEFVHFEIPLDDIVIAKNPAYTTDPVAMVGLIEELGRRGHQIFMDNETFKYAVNLYPHGRHPYLEVSGQDTLPMAVAEAVGKLIDAENTASDS